MFWGAIYVTHFKPTRIKIAIPFFLLSLFACSGLSSASSPSCENLKPQKLTMLEVMNFDKSVGDRAYSKCNKLDIDACVAAANGGDTSAMLKLGYVNSDHLTNFIFTRAPNIGYHFCSDEPNGSLAISWFEKAASNGSCEALQALQNIYRAGKITMGSSRLSDKYTSDAFALNCEWAKAAIVSMKIKNREPKAVDELVELAISGNCHAQLALSKGYNNGFIDLKLGHRRINIEQNYLKAFFWSLIRSQNWGTRKNIKLDRGFTGTLRKCKKPDDVSVLINTQNFRKEISVDDNQLVEDAAISWKVGMPEPSLSAPSKPKNTIAKPAPSNIPDKQHLPEKRVFPKGFTAQTPSYDNKSWSWKPVSLTLNMEHIADENALRPDELFKLADKIVWKVFAATSFSDLEKLRNVSQGSAVSISNNKLLTNCHVIKGKHIIVLKNKETFLQASVYGGDAYTDRCILKVDDPKLKFIHEIRAYKSLSVGETVFTIGSPSGLENTLGEGIISGLRNDKGQQLIQTTAQISPGSSGGGLFDAQGRLIGVTTFLLRDAQSLNFAISAEEYTQ